MSSFYKNILWAIITLLVMSVTFSAILETTRKTEEVSLNALAGKIIEGKVSKITVSGESLEIILTDGVELTSKKEAEASLTETLGNLGVDAPALKGVEITIQEQSGARFWLGVLIPTLLPVIIIVGIFWFMFRQARTGVNQAFNFSRSGIRLSNLSKDKTTFKDVAGVKEAKEELIEVVEFLKNPKKFLDLGARIPRGVLMVGLPGTGKTLLAKAVAGEASVPFFNISASEFVEMFVGVGASVTGDTPVLIKTKKSTKLSSIGKFIDQYYRDNEEGLKNITDVETLGFKPLETKFRGARSKEKSFFGGSQWSKVKSVYRHRVNKIYKIHFRGGVIKTTGDHSLFIRSKNMIISKKASELKSGDILVNLPFKVRSSFMPGFGTTHKVRAHNFREESELSIKELDLYDQEYKEQMEKYEFVLANRGLLTQTKIGAAVGMSQGGVKDWQIGNREPRILNSNLVKVGTPTKIPVTRELLKLLGYYTAEGKTDPYSTQFTFGLHETDLHPDCIETIRGIFKLEPATLPIPETNSFRISISSPFISRFFEKHCGNGSHNKHIPEFLWRLPKKYFLSYLEGYSKGDGYTTKDGKLSATSVSKQLILELGWLCAMHGIQTGVRESIAPAGRTIRPGGKPLPETRSWNLIIGKTSHPFAIKTIKSPHQYKKPIIQKIEEETYDGYVYDLCGCENEAFFGGEKPILLHNSRTRDAFATAKKAAPSILFIDEIDAVGRQRGAGLGGGNDEREQTLNQILVELDGFDSSTKVIVIAATNRPDVLDPALLRPGRFDRRIVLDLPDIEEREAILRIHARGKILAKDIDFRKIAVRTPGFSGADLANLMNEAAILAARQNKKLIEQPDFFNAVEKVLLGPERRSRVTSNHEREITAYHEGGHALVAASLKNSDPVHKVSIISRGMAGGYTMKLPLEEQRLRTKTQFLNDLSVMLAGLVSEKIKFDDISTGASSDLKEATKLAHRMVTKYGMSEGLGPVTFGSTEELIFLGREISTEKNYSEKIAEKIDGEIHSLIDRAQKTAEKIIKTHKNALQKIAETLIKKETLEGDEFYALLKPYKIKPIAVA